MMKRVGKWIWMFYKFFCLLFATGAILLFLFDEQEVLLPNGVYISKTPLLSFGGEEYHLLKNNYEHIDEAAIEFLCFNDDYIYASTLSDYNIVYSIKEDKAVTSKAEDYEAFSALHKTSNLTNGCGCNGYFKSLIGASLLFDRVGFLEKAIQNAPSRVFEDMCTLQ